MNPRCQYCGQEIPEGQQFCSADCAQRYEAAVVGGGASQKWLFLGLAICLVVILLGPITGTDQMVGLGVAAMGVVVARWPFAIVELMRRVGYAWAREICRAVGVTIIPLGFVTIFFI